MTKDRVLMILKSQQGYISGENMSKEIGVSRAAIHTAINKLRQEGYTIKSVTNRGYMLEESTDCISIGELAHYLGEKRTENIICLDTVDSTNTKMKELAQQGATEGSVVIANQQTAGRGRLGRKFESNKNDGIYLTMLVRPNCAVVDIAEITAWVAVCVAKAIEKITGSNPGIKWVNDVLINNKKVCGILTEVSVEGESGMIQYLVTGIGINVHNKKESFPEKIQSIASSLECELKKDIRRSELVAELIKELDVMFLKWPSEKRSYLEYYKNACVNIGKEVRVIKNQETKIGKAEGITDQFELIVAYDDGTREIVSSGEVSVRGLYGYV